MAFNGTKRFKPGELIAALESTGARLGPHVNAYTSFDETVYMFELPTDKTGLVEKGMQALADFAGGMSARSGGDRQGARRRGRGVARRPRRRLAPARPADSGALLRVQVRRTPADRQARDSQGFKPERLRAFYTKWYRPDRMAVVAVGDIDGRRDRSAGASKEFGAPDEAGGGRAGPHLRRAAADGAAGQGGDRSRSDAVIGLADQQAAADSRKGPSARYRRNLVHRLAFQMLNERFDELSRKPDAQFLDAGAYESGLSPTTSTVGLGASVQEGKIPAGLTSVVIEAKRAVQHGFGAGELDRAKKRIVASYDRAYNERDKTESGGLRPGVRQPLPRETSPARASTTSASWCRRCCPASPPPTSPRRPKQLFGGASRVILATSPQKQGPRRADRSGAARRGRRAPRRSR